MKGIPIILETPSFDVPQEVWDDEINILGRLSRLLQASNSEPNSDGRNVEALVEEISLAVNKAKRPAWKCRITIGFSTRTVQRYVSL
jgi:AP endonuclease-1